MSGQWLACLKEELNNFTNQIQFIGYVELYSAYENYYIKAFVVPFVDSPSVGH